MEKPLAAESTECRTVHNGLVDDGGAFRSEMQLKGVGLAVRTGLGGKAHPIFQAHRGFTESIGPVPTDIDVRCTWRPCRVSGRPKKMRPWKAESTAEVMQVV